MASFGNGGAWDFTGIPFLPWFVCFHHYHKVLLNVYLLLLLQLLIWLRPRLPRASRPARVWLWPDTCVNYQFLMLATAGMAASGDWISRKGANPQGRDGVFFASTDRYLILVPSSSAFFSPLGAQCD